MLQINSYITKISTLPDRSLKITIETQELPPNEMTEIFELMEKYCVLALQEQEKGDIMESDLDIPEVTMEFKNDKTPSVRLRNAIYVYYTQNNHGKETFDEFYKRNMEKIISKIKENLN